MLILICKGIFYYGQGEILIFVSQEKNLELAMKFWKGEPSGKLMWYLDAGGPAIENCAKIKGYRDDVEFLQKELGCIIWGNYVVPYTNNNNSLNIEVIREGSHEIVRYISPYGVLHEKRKDGQIIEYKINNEDDLRILIKIWGDTEVAPAYDQYDKTNRLSAGKWPVMPGMAECSALQHLMQHEMGVERFWYMFADYPALMEESFEVWQHLMKKRYTIIENLPAVGFYQAENTSTTMISPAFYKKYSLGHIRELTSMSAKAGKRSLVHMCGRLRDIMPMLRETGMNGIHSLTPPTTGDTDFEYAISIMPEDFFMLGRFGSTYWLNKTKDEIMNNLASILPPHIFREHAFVLIVTADGVRDISFENLYLLRDCINEYERKHSDRR